MCVAFPLFEYCIIVGMIPVHFFPIITKEYYKVGVGCL